MQTAPAQRPTSMHGWMAEPTLRPLKAFADTDQGEQRDNNEDEVFCDVAQRIFFVIDGMGGQAAGERAAAEAKAILAKQLALPQDSPEARMRKAIVLANNTIHQLAAADETLRGMACVLTAAILEGNDLVYGHVGDTRLYLLSPYPLPEFSGKRAPHPHLVKLSNDHSPVGEREETGELTEADAMSHPRRNEVFRDVGSQPRTSYEDNFIETGRYEFRPEYALLLCSDGLTDLVGQQEMLGIVEELARAGASAERIVRALIQAANAAGGKDNVSVVYVEGPDYAPLLRGEQVAVSRSSFQLNFCKVDKDID